LFQRVRTKLGYAYSVSAAWGANFDHPGLFQISGSTKSGSTTETIQVIREEVEKMRSAKVTDEELTSAKESVANSFVFNFDRPSKTLNRILFYDYYGYPKDFINQYLAGIQKVSKADVLRVAREHLSPKDFTVTAVGIPTNFGKPLTALGTVTPIDLSIP
jgi:zinc protease